MKQRTITRTRVAPFRLKRRISEQRIAEAVRKLARQVDGYCLRHGLNELTVVCVMDGAFVFCADLVRHMPTPATFVFVKARSYNGTRRAATNLERLPAAMQGRPVLVVDTIFDTGKTISKVLRAVRKRTSRIALAILVVKQGKADLAAHTQGIETFVGIRLPGDPFLVGYGLDCGGQFRHLRDIRVFAGNGG